MSKAIRTCISLFVGFVCANVGFFIAAVFVPLLFPATLAGTSPGENFAGPLLAIFFFLLFGSFGFMACWKFTRRWARPTRDVQDYTFTNLQR